MPEFVIDARCNQAGHAPTRVPAVPPNFRRPSQAPEAPQKSLTVAAWRWVKRTRRRLTVKAGGAFSEMFPTCPRNVATVVVFSRAMDWKNKLYFGDNLNILRDCVADASIDLIYLDPQFNSNANYNVLFKEKSGEESAAQITAFEDTWQWSLEAEAVYKEIVTSGPRLT